jgi:hypothetical protein
VFLTHFLGLRNWENVQALQKWSGDVSIGDIPESQSAWNDVLHCKRDWVGLGSQTKIRTAKLGGSSQR